MIKFYADGLAVFGRAFPSSGHWRRVSRRHLKVSYRLFRTERRRPRPLFRLFISLRFWKWRPYYQWEIRPGYGITYIDLGPIGLRFFHYSAHR